MAKFRNTNKPTPWVNNQALDNAILAKASEGELGTAARVDVGTDTGTIPTIPVKMSQMSPVVKTTIDSITANDDSAAYHPASDFALDATVEPTLSDLQQSYNDLNTNFLYLLKWVIVTFGVWPEGLEDEVQPALEI